jgi:threonine/homoserine/homoserine lactone efflux protein
MHIDLSVLGLYIAAVIAMIAIPGPVVLLVTGAGLSRGPIGALRTIAGTNVASLVLIAISAFILKGLLSVNEAIFIGVKLLGSLYIGYIAIQMLREKSPNAHQAPLHSPSAYTGGFSKGFVMGISNAKDIIFFSSFFPQFINVTQNVNTSLALLTILWVVLDFATLMLVYMLISKVTKPTIHHKLMRVAGALLLLIACAGATMSLLALTTE